ncbi:MAG: hypothetical protein JNL58_26745 [Planctomyces sp.]|nr:hypothetical protein [Planctomyces sp.]
MKRLVALMIVVLGMQQLTSSEQAWAQTADDNAPGSTGVPLLSGPSAFEDSSTDRTFAEVESDLKQMRKENADLDLLISAASGQLKNPNVNREDQIRELRKLVDHSFELRLQIQESESQRLRLKLKQIEQNLVTRAKMRETIVERRMKELMQSAETTRGPQTELSSRVSETRQNPDLPQTNATILPSSADPNNPNSITITENPQLNPVEAVIRISDRLRQLRQAATRIRKDRQPHENLISQYSRPLEELKAEGIVAAETTEEDLRTQIERSRPEFERLSNELDPVVKAWQHTWLAYQAQIRLLRLDLAKAESELDSCTSNHARMSTLHERGAVAQGELSDSNAALANAKFNLDKAREILNFCSLIADSEPELNPGAKSGAESGELRTY